MKPTDRTPMATASQARHAGYRTPAAMVEATGQDRVDALGRGHCKRYDESTARTLGDGAGQVIRQYGGDRRRLRDQANGGARRAGLPDGRDDLAELLTESGHPSRLAAALVRLSRTRNPAPGNPGKTARES